MDIIKRILRSIKSDESRCKHFSGNLFERFSGLDFILSKCAGCTILDVASCEGLVSYEFARNGATLIHGLEVNAQGVKFSQRLFRNVPIESCFIQADLAIDAATAHKKYGTFLLEEYDIVLFLGIYHHLKAQMPEHDLQDLLNYLLTKTKTWFVVRTNMLPEFEHVILSNSFELAHEASKCDSVGMLKIYKRII